MNRIRVNANNVIINTLDNVLVYPLIASFPLNTNISLKEVINNRVVQGISSADLVEATIGSLVIVKKGEIPRQLPFVVPRTSTIFEILNTSSSNGSFDLIEVPSRVSLEAGFIYLIFDLTDIYNILWRYLLVRFNNVALDEYIIRINENEQVKCIIDKKDIEEEIETFGRLSNNFSQLRISRYLDPKAVVKASIYPHISAWSIRVLDLNPGYHTVLSYVQPMDYLMIDLKVEDEIISSIIKEVSREEPLSVKFLRLRSGALASYVDILFQNLSNNIDPYKAILYTYCIFIVERGHNYIMRASRTKTINLDLAAYSQALAYALIEMGLHGISHLLIRYVALRLKTDVSRLREFIAIVGNIPSHINNQPSALKTYLGIIDGYIFRAKLGMSISMETSPNSIFGVVGVILPKPYSKKLIDTVFQNNHHILEEIKSYANKIIGLNSSDNCYNTWLSNKGIADTTFNRTIGFLSRVNISNSYRLSLGEILKKIKDLTETRFNIKRIRSGDDLSSILYIPRVDYRRILINNILRSIIEDELKKQGNIDQDTIKSYLEETKHRIKVYAPMIYETSVPYCFDGCYNCVLLKDCGSKHPIINEWMISKAMTKIILQYISLS